MESHRLTRHVASALYERHAPSYTEEDVARHGIDRDRVAFLQKPFTAGALARKVREVIRGSVAG
jgi:hypothetical protein